MKTLKYETPTLLDLSLKTSLAQDCAGGSGAEWCQTGTSAGGSCDTGGTVGCNNGTSALLPGGCFDGDEVA